MDVVGIPQITKQSLIITLLAFVCLGTQCLSSSIDVNCASGQCDNEGSNERGVAMLQVRHQRERTNVKLNSSENPAKLKMSMQDSMLASRDAQCDEKIVEIGVGSCYDGGAQPESLGWSKCTCGTDKPGFGWCVGACQTVEICEAECLENPECGGFMYSHLHCWMFKKMYNPGVKYNDPSTWYKCYVKDKCCPGKCCPPFKSCAAWGDPHYTNTFFGGHKLMDFMGLGLYRVATTLDNTFELQAYQCPYKPGIAIFVAFALKVRGSTISIIGDNVTIDGKKMTTSSRTHSTGLKVETLYAPDDRATLESPDNCIHFSSINFAHAPAPNGYFHNFQLYLADDKASSAGVCGASNEKTAIPESQSLFSADENSYLCKLCGMTDCATMTPPAGWASLSGPDEACSNAGISMTQAQEKCSAVEGDFLSSCIYDYCASAGNMDMVANAVESEQEEEAQAKAVEGRGAQNLDLPEPINMCERPYLGCAAWGDPHWTRSFYWRSFDFHGLGVFTLAKSTDGNFELQAFQCPFGDTWGKVFAGFAMNVRGSRITIIDRNISINGRLFLGETHASGLKVESTHKDRDTVTVHSIDNCVHLKVNSHFDRPIPSQSPGWGHDMFLDMAQSVVSWKGVCGTFDWQTWTPLARDNTLFGYSELDAICSNCGISDCAYMTPPAELIQATDKVTSSVITNQDVTKSYPPSLQEVCQQAGISIATAREQCKEVLPDESYLFSPERQAAYLDDCAFDYCVSGGSEEMLVSAAESEKEEVKMDTAGGI